MEKNHIKSICHVYTMIADRCIYEHFMVIADGNVCKHYFNS